MVSGAFISAAGAQVVTEQFGVTVRVIGLAVPSGDLSYQLNGGPATPFPPNGTAVLALDVAGSPYTFTPVPFPGYTATVDDAIPGIDCTDVTLVVGTPGFCRITFSEIVATTTTTTTTTTTSTTVAPPTTNQEQKSVSGSRQDANRCRSHLEPNLNPDANLRIGATLSTDAFGQPHLGKPITLSNTKLGLAIPAALLQQGIDLDLVHAGQQIPSVITVGVNGVNTDEKSHTYVIHANAVVQTVPVPVSAKYPKGLKALPLNVTLALADTNWTPVSDSADVTFSEKSLLIVATLQLPGIGKVVVTFTCQPDSSEGFVALGAQGPPTPPTPGGGGGGGGVTVGTQANGGATQLPRTGSNPWALLVVAAVCIDLGMLALAAAKRRRRPLHQS